MAVIVGVARETVAGERRVALTPETCKKLVAAGATVRIQPGIGVAIGRKHRQSHAIAAGKVLQCGKSV